MNDVILTQGSEVSVNSKNNKIVWQTFLYCHCKNMNSARACTGCRGTGITNAWTLVGSMDINVEFWVLFVGLRAVYT